MTNDSFEDIAVAMVAKDRARAQFQVRDIGARLAQSYKHGALGAPTTRPYTPNEARAAIRARDALIKELLK